MMLPKLRTILIFVAVVIVALAIMLLYISSALNSLKAAAVPPVTGVINGNVTLARSSILTFNSSQFLVDYALLRYGLRNVSSINASLTVYAKQPIEPIYLVSTKVGIIDYCIQCYDQGTLYFQLQSYLNGLGLAEGGNGIKYVDLENLSTVPGNSIIIIESGLLPSTLMPYSAYGGAELTSGNVTLLSLLNSGDTVIYIGKNFSTSIGNGGSIFLTPSGDIQALENASIVTAPYFNYSSYVKGQAFTSPTFSFLGGKDYGNVSSVSSGKGTLIAFSNYPTSGWKNSTAMANDIAHVIDSRFWIDRLAYGYSNVTAVNRTSGVVPIITMQEYMNNTVESVDMLNNSYSLVKVYLYNSNGMAVQQFAFQQRYNSTSNVTMPGVFGETQSLPITVSSGNIVNGQNDFHLNVTDGNGTSFASLPIGFYSKPFTIIHFYSFEIPSGYYIATLQDIQGKSYSGALFYVANVSIVPYALSFKNGTYIFKLSSNRIPITNTSYAVSLNGAYTQNGLLENGTVEYTLPRGAVEGYGSKSFEFNMFGTTYTYITQYSASTSGIPPLYIEFGIAAIFIIILNLVLKAPTADDYYIDVPNFPPVKRVKLKTDSNTIIGIFDSVNLSYRWRYMPLTPEEVKNGVSSSMRYQNVPIAVTLQNVSSVLNRLTSENLLVTSGGYYAPQKWLSDSKHDIEYLTIFRRLRDYCVTNAMLFTDLDAEPHVDMIITKRGAQGHIIIYSSISGMKEIALNNSYKIYIVFLSEGQRLDFMTELYNSYGEKAELLKIGIEHSYIVLLDLDNLDQLLI